MIEWRDESIVLASRRHGENDAILSLMTFEHGRHLGLVRGGGGRRLSPLLQPANRLDATWKARIVDHLGHLAVEPVRLYAGMLLDDPLRLAAASGACALVDIAMPERDPHPQLFAALLTLLERLVENRDWTEAYVRFELLLLAELGFGLDLSTCAVTGATEGLAFVSPRTGKAVTSEGAGAYVDRLLTLPAFLVGSGDAEDDDIAAGLRLAGSFLDRHILAPVDKPMPLARERFVALWNERLDKTEDVEESKE
jgi:DNA repair protein RecO (recombination protein O)